MAVVLALGANAGWLAATPAWEAPDEPWHLAFAESLVAGRHPTAADTYEAHQAPGYYVALAGAMTVLDMPVVPRAPDNPYFPFAEAAYWHVPGDPGEPGLRLLRYVAGLVGMLVTALAWATGRRAGLPGAAAFACAAGVALTPQFAYIRSVISNDGLAALAGAVLVYAALAWPRARRRATRLLILGAALAVIAKATALAAMAGPAGTVCLRRNLRPAGALAVGVGIAVGVWLVSPLPARPYLDDLSMRARSVQVSSLDPIVLRVLARDTMISAFGRFGWLSVDYPPGVLRLAGVVFAVGLGLGLVWFGASRRRLAAGVVLVAAAVAPAAAVARHWLADPQPQGRLMLPGLTAAWVLVAGGLVAVLPRRFQYPAAACLTMVLAAANLLAWTRVMPAAYGRWTGPEPVVAARTYSGGAAVAARIRGAGAGLRQSFRAHAPVVKVSTAVALSQGGGTAEVRLRDSMGWIVAERSVEIARLRPNDWLEIELSESVPAGVYVLEIEMVRGRGELRLWGNAEGTYDEGELTVNGDPSTAIALVAVAGTAGTAPTSEP